MSAAGAPRSNPPHRRRVVVTGAAKRVGRAIALELARRGCDLELTYRTSAEAMEATSREVKAAASSAGHSIDVAIHRADFSDTEAVARLAGTLAERCATGLFGLVHNASSYGPTPLDTLTAEEALGHFTVNALAPLLLTQALAEPLRRAGGSVVFFSDIHVLGRPRKRFLAYSMSKAAASDLVATLALSLAPEVRVNGVAPGVVAWPEDAALEEREAYEARIPLARPGTPEDAAGVVRWLLFEAPYVTGDIVRLDGGRWLR